MVTHGTIPLTAWPWNRVSFSNSSVILRLEITVSSESLDYDVLKIDLGEDVTISNSDIWLNGDILVDGNLSIENSHINVNRSIDLTISEIRINSTG